MSSRQISIENRMRADIAFFTLELSYLKYTIIDMGNHNLCPCKEVSTYLRYEDARRKIRRKLYEQGDKTELGYNITTMT